MINGVIIEDETVAQQWMVSTLKEVMPDLVVRAILTTVKESIEYFRENASTHIIFCDVQLPDGLSFEIFTETNIKTPAIFITGYNDFVLQAFENNAIDYLLKPISKEELGKSILKYKMLEKHFNLQRDITRKTRLLVKKGCENISMRLQDVVMVYTENKIVYVIDKSGLKFITNKTLNELELELDDSLFFRANRQYIINLAFVKSYKAYEKVKLQVDLNVHERINSFIIISQNTAPDFRKWIAQA